MLTPRDTATLKALDALQSLCDPKSPVLIAYTAAAGAAAHAAMIRHKERPEPPTREETEAALKAMLDGNPLPNVDSALLRTAERRAVQALGAFIKTPAVTLPEIAFKALAVLAVLPGGAPAALTDDITRYVEGGGHG